MIYVVAVLASLYSLYNTIKTRQDAAKAQAISDFYSTFYEFDRLHLENWQLSHLFAMPDQYRVVAKQVAGRKKYTDDERTEYALKEKAVARFIFDIFENTIYQWQQANAARDQGRSEFLGEVLEFLANKALRNPRLLSLWQFEIENYEHSTIEYYRNHVTEDSGNPLTHPADPTGPFAKRGR